MDTVCTVNVSMQPRRNWTGPHIPHAAVAMWFPLLEDVRFTCTRLRRQCLRTESRLTLSCAGLLSVTKFGDASKYATRNKLCEISISTPFTNTDSFQLLQYKQYITQCIH